MSPTTETELNVADVIEHWDDDPTNVAQTVMDQYGEPDTVGRRRLIWYDCGPWKRTVMRPDGAEHAFPDHHVDYLEQVIDYHVPPDRTDEIITFDGSVTIRRTRGELSVECHGEPANYLAINLVHDILEGDKTVEEARDVYAEIYARKEAGDQPTYITELTFEPPVGDQADRDEVILTERHEEAAMAYVDD